CLSDWSSDVCSSDLTDDGGASWKPLDPKTLPPALPDEGAFAASGTCLAAHGTDDVWFCTGGAKVARVFHSSDRGRSWTAAETTRSEERRVGQECGSR